MKIKDVLILWDNGKNNLQLCDIDATSDRRYFDADNKLGACCSEWNETGHARLVLLFVELMQAMLRDRSITIDNVMREIVRVDELSCCFADDIFNELGLPLPTDEEVTEYAKALKRELTREGLKMKTKVEA